MPGPPISARPRTPAHPQGLCLPRGARLPISRCSLPPAIVGGLTFLRDPCRLELDGVAVLHRALFETLAGLATAAARAQRFRDYMTANFRLDNLPEAGFEPRDDRPGRARADYRQLLRGWHFDADGREAAVLKGWVESRFGLLARHHGGPLDDPSGPIYRRYLAERARGLYNTNALEAQLDLLYSFAQYELERRLSGVRHLCLYRGMNRLGDQLLWRDGARAVVLLNNLVSFADAPERAGEFGDHIVEAQIPRAKLLFFPGLLPGALDGEREHLVIGGLCEVRLLA